MEVFLLSHSDFIRFGIKNHILKKPNKIKLKINEGINKPWPIETSCHILEYDKTLRNDTETE